ncbi:MAG: VOC family protein [Deltaproteobacteria bacterium]|nr:VOC family protein [Deltaproteobacteria bacterium]
MAEGAVLLEHLLEEADFGRAASGLAADFRGKYGLPPIHQLGLVVADVEEAAQRLEKRGIGPFFIAAGSPVYWRERGTEGAFRGKMGIAYLSGLELELLEPGEGSDFYRRSLDPGRGTVVQHLGMIVKDVDEWAGRLVAAGFPIFIRGRLRAFPMTTEFAYMDTEETAGFIMEFISWKLFGMPFSMPPSVFHAIGRLERWSGKRTINL